MSIWQYFIWLTFIYMNKRQFVSKLAKNFEVNNKEADALLDVFISTIIDSLLEWQEVNLHWFGKFSIIRRSAKKGFNPKTREPMQIAAYSTPTFKAWEPLKNAIKNKFN